MADPKTSRELARWKAALASGNPARISQVARDLTEARSKVDTDFRFTVTDNYWVPVASIGNDLIEASGTDPRNNTPSARLTIKGSSDLIDIFMGCRSTMVGVIVETAGLRMPFYVKSHKYKYEKSAWTGTVELKGIWDVLNYMVIWPSWWLPIQTQPFSHAIFFWALCTCLENMVAECALRLQSGINEFINNALSLNPDIRAWFGTILQGLERDGLSLNTFTRMLKTPIYVKRTNPFLDASPMYGRTVRMETVGSVIAEATRPYGVTAQMDLWLPGDPQPDQWANLTTPTYVFSTRDRSQITGPFGNVLDSVVRTVVDLGGSLGGIFNPIVQQVPGMDGVFTSDQLGVHYEQPYAILVAPDQVMDKNGIVTSDDSSIVACEVDDHTQDGWQHIIGGRCVSGETLVHTADGLVEAQSLEGREVMTLSQDGVYRPAKWQSYGEQQLFKVTFRNGDELFATHNHEWVVEGRPDRVTTLELVGERVPVVADAARFGQPNYLTPRGLYEEVVSVETTDRIETVYCCEEPVTQTWVAGSGYLTSNSPKWLNDLLNALFAWIIDSIMIILGFAGIPSDLLAGFLNNAFFAFQLVQVYDRRAAAGPYHPAMERFYPTASAPYNIETVFAFINAIFDSRGYTAAKVTFRNGDQYALGRDIFKGGLMSLVYRNRRYMVTDYIENIMWRITKDERTVMCQLGDGQKDEAPLAKHQRLVTAAFEAISVLTLSPQSSS